MLSPRIAGAALLMVLLAACAAPRSQVPDIDADLAAKEAAKQKELVLEAWLAERARLNRVVYPLLAGAVPFCGDTLRPSIGIQVTNSQAFDPDLRTTAASVLGGDDHLQIVQVIEGFPGADAGLAVGDLLVSVNGIAAPRGEGALADWAGTMDDKMDDADPIEMAVLRDGTERTVRMVPRMICDYPASIAPSKDINAFADGKGLHVNKGLMDFVDTDQELALVMAHEVAHNAMGHIPAMEANGMAGGFGGLLLDVLAATAGVNTGGAFTRAGAQTGASAYSADFEAEADYVGLYIMARAGFPIEGAANFWRRMGVANPGSIELAGDHPTSPRRFLAVEKTIAEIEAKQAAGLPLLPDMKEE